MIKPPKQETLIPRDYPPWLPVAVFEEWKRERAKKGKKHIVTEGAEKHALVRLSELRDQGYDPESVIRTAIVAGHDGFFPRIQDKKPTWAKREQAERDWQQKKMAGPKTPDQTRDVWRKGSGSTHRQHFEDFMQIFQNPCVGGPEGQYKQMLALEEKYPGHGWKEEAERWKQLIMGKAPF